MITKNFIPFPILNTERLLLRQLDNSDDEKILSLRSNESVNQYIDRESCQSIHEARTFIQTINEHIEKNESIYWAITLKEANTLIGTACLFNFSDENMKAEIGYELLPSAQGKGFMQEASSAIIDFAFRQIGLHTIEAYVHFNNERSIQLLQKLNFRKHDWDDNGFTVFKLTTYE